MQPPDYQRQPDLVLCLSTRTDFCKCGLINMNVLSLFSRLITKCFPCGSVNSAEPLLRPQLPLYHYILELPKSNISLWLGIVQQTGHDLAQEEEVKQFLKNRGMPGGELRAQ